MKLPRGLREATPEERPAFDAAKRCIIIRVYEPPIPEGRPKEMACPSYQKEGGHGLCEYHAKEIPPEESFSLEGR